MCVWVFGMPRVEKAKIYHLLYLCLEYVKLLHYLTFWFSLYILCLKI